MNNSASRPSWRCAPTARARSGFTLIELLVVIAIIAILASILFPVFSRARENARRASCQSNLKQISLGFMQYTQDYDERLPGSTDGTPGQGKLGGWTYYITFPTSGTTYNPNLTFDPTQGSVYPYIKSAQVFVCPSDATDQAQSYAINSCVDSAAANEPHVGKKLSYFQDTSSWMLLNEEGGQVDQLNGSTDDGYMAYSGNVFSTRHFGGSNVSFIDGHVKWFNVNDLVNKGFQTGGTGACP